MLRFCNRRGRNHKKHIATAGYTAPAGGRGEPGTNIRIAYMELGK
jgi:hypothetical protein